MNTSRNASILLGETERKQGLHSLGPSIGTLSTPVGRATAFVRAKRGALVAAFAIASQARDSLASCNGLSIGSACDFWRLLGETGAILGGGSVETPLYATTPDSDYSQPAVS